MAVPLLVGCPSWSERPFRFEWETTDPHFWEFQEEMWRHFDAQARQVPFAQTEAQPEKIDEEIRNLLAILRQRTKDFPQALLRFSPL